MSLLAGFRVVEIGGGLAAAVCGRLLADIGAEVTCLGPDNSTPLANYLNHGKPIVAGDPAAALSAAELIVCEGRPQELRARGYDAAGLRQINPKAALVFISPFGQTGPQANDPATDLTLFFASGMARLLTGQVDDLAEPPMRPVGEQSAFIGGLAAACAGMHAALSAEPGAVIDVSIHEALATMAATELARAGLGGRIWSRRRLTDGNGATVTILPARDGYAAISPREDRQWAAWLEVMGSPDWASDPRFARKPDRVANWDALHALDVGLEPPIRQAIDRRHGPGGPCAELPVARAGGTAEFGPARAPQLLAAVRYRRTNDPGAGAALRAADHARRSARIRRPCGPMPLSGIRVLDFSWVIAGPTATRYLAAMGAEVIKIEAPGRGDPGRTSELHTVLGQAKRSVVLDLKKKEAVAVARELAAKSDVLIENFATGVMDRLGLGAEALRALNPDLIYVSASGLGRTGPEAHAVAYGTLLQCYAGFAGLNRHPDIAPRIGFAWLDPMCGLMLAFIAAAALWHRQRTGGVARVDFSMIEAMLWTMAEPLLAAQLGAPPQPQRNHSDRYVPHGVYRCAGEDDWISIAVTTDDEWRRLCAIVPALSAMAGMGFRERTQQRAAIDEALTAWSRPQSASAAAAELLRAGIPAAALANSRDLVASDHLRERGFWEAHGTGVLPGLPWRASFGRTSGAAPELGADTERFCEMCSTCQPTKSPRCANRARSDRNGFRMASVAVRSARILMGTQPAHKGRPS